LLLQKSLEAGVGKNHSHLKKSRREELTAIVTTGEMTESAMMTEEKKGMLIGTEGVATEAETIAITEVGKEAGKTVAVTDMTNATNVTIATVTTQTVAEISKGVKEEMRPKGSGPEKIVINAIKAATVAKNLFR
jgi:hypothetical protein